MLTIKGKNVNEIYPVGILQLTERGVQVDSRNGPTLEIPEPASIQYLLPCERVLFDATRDSNHFLGFFEALWIIAGRQDVKFLADIVPNMANFSDDGVRYFSAYGHRLRHLAPGRADGTARDTDQIREAIDRLKANPDDRQVVLTIRDPQDMWYRGKDTACNLMVDCKIRSGRLNIHVFNRSNDFVWGMLGTNAVQFSTLQEYMAGHIGCAVGTYHQTTSSMHVYVNEQWSKIQNGVLSFWEDAYATASVSPYPMMQGNLKEWERDLRYFFKSYDHAASVVMKPQYFLSPYFREVVAPMWETLLMWKLYKEERTISNYERMLKSAYQIKAEDWKLAVMQWLERRAPK